MAVYTMANKCVIDHYADLFLDLQPANILFSADWNLSSDILLEPEFNPVNWLPDVEVDSSAPQYLVTSQRPRGMLDDVASSELTVKIGDLGGG